MLAALELLTTGDIMQLQRTMGNQVIERFFTETMAQDSLGQEAPGDEGLALTERLAPEGVPTKLRTLNGDRSIQKKENQTGLKDSLKMAIEHLSGLSLDDVKVHYNSTKPAQLNALAYTQGSEIHVGPGQEYYVPHEVWHVIQQKQGRVKPTMQLKGIVTPKAWQGGA